MIKFENVYDHPLVSFEITSMNFNTSLKLNLKLSLVKIEFGI